MLWEARTRDGSQLRGAHGQTVWSNDHCVAVEEERRYPSPRYSLCRAIPCQRLVEQEAGRGISSVPTAVNMDGRLLTIPRVPRTTPQQPAISSPMNHQTLRTHRIILDPVQSRTPVCRRWAEAPSHAVGPMISASSSRPHSRRAILDCASHVGHS